MHSYLVRLVAKLLARAIIYIRTLCVKSSESLWNSVLAQANLNLCCLHMP